MRGVTRSLVPNAQNPQQPHAGPAALDAAGRACVAGGGWLGGIALPSPVPLRDTPWSALRGPSPRRAGEGSGMREGRNNPMRGVSRGRLVPNAQNPQQPHARACCVGNRWACAAGSGWLGGVALPSPVSLRDTPLVRSSRPKPAKGGRGKWNARNAQQPHEAPATRAPGAECAKPATTPCGACCVGSRRSGLAPPKPTAGRAGNTLTRVATRHLPSREEHTRQQWALTAPSQRGRTKPRSCTRHDPLPSPAMREKRVWRRCRLAWHL
jgi:hypothetical protein